MAPLEHRAKNMLFEFNFVWFGKSCFRINHLHRSEIFSARTIYLPCRLVTGDRMPFSFYSFHFDRHLFALHMQIEFLFVDPKFDRNHGMSVCRNHTNLDYSTSDWLASKRQIWQWQSEWMGNRESRFQSTRFDRHSSVEYKSLLTLMTMNVCGNPVPPVAHDSQIVTT